jgi:diaminopimelate decarboxylase
MTYYELKDRIIFALANKDEEEVRHLFSLDGRWFLDIIEEIESETELSEDTRIMIRKAVEA